MKETTKTAAQIITEIKSFFAFGFFDIAIAFTVLPQILQYLELLCIAVLQFSQRILVSFLPTNKYKIKPIKF
jgi:hypothetical protein